MAFSGYALAAAFTQGNILVSQDEVLYEYTLSGEIVQQIDIPHPDTNRYDALDVVTDGLGRALVLNLAPFDNDYLSIYDPETEVWEHLLIQGFLGNTSDGDLSILDNFVFTKDVRINLETNNFIEMVDIPGFGVGEISVGLDGLLYALDSGSPRPGVRVLDPDTLELVREMDLLDQFGSRINARGISVSETGLIYALDFDGDIIEYASDGTYIDDNLSLVQRTSDIDLRSDGTLIGGGDDGRFFVHTVNQLGVSNPVVFTVPNSSFDSTYLGFVNPLGSSEEPEPEPEPPVCFPIQTIESIAVICL